MHKAEGKYWVRGRIIERELRVKYIAIAEGINLVYPFVYVRTKGYGSCLLQRSFDNFVFHSFIIGRSLTQLTPCLYFQWNIVCWTYVVAQTIASKPLIVETGYI